MLIKNNFEVPLPPDQAWDVLMDIPRIAPCLPGAELTEALDDGTFKGKVAVKLGPVALVFNGTAEIIDRDDAAHTARVKARGADLKGRGGANATVDFSLSPTETGSRVEVVTDVTLSGSVAQYGRGVGIIQGVATQLVGQFAKSLHDTLPGSPAPATAPTPSSTSPVASPAAAPRPPAPAAKPISGFGLMLRVLWSAITGLFRRRDPGSL
jgi:carbon monoxide dehydrogenase subunit G